MTRSAVIHANAKPSHEGEYQFNRTRDRGNSRGPAAHRALVNVKERGARYLRQAQGRQCGSEVVGGHSVRGPHSGGEPRIVADKLGNGVLAPLHLVIGHFSELWIDGAVVGQRCVFAVSQRHQNRLLATLQLVAERVGMAVRVIKQRDQLARVHVAVWLGMVGHLILQRAWAPFRMTTPYQDILSGVKGFA